jgi:lipopolysaccharide transport system ATP-binding protein
MEEIARGGRTVLFVSHNMAALQALCPRGILFAEGRVAADTSGSEAVRAYLTDCANVVAQPLGDRKDRRGDGRLRFTECWLENSAGIRVSKAVVGENMRFCMAYRAREPLRNVQVGLTFQESLGTPLVYCYTADVGQGFKVMPEEGVVVCEITKFPLRSSRYLGDIFARVQNQASDWVQGAFFFDVEDADFYGTGKLDVFHSTGKVLVSHAWDVRQEGTRFFLASS